MPRITARRLADRRQRWAYAPYPQVDGLCGWAFERSRVGHLDHAIPWPAGPTTAANLTGYCASHHRGKHQAPGWQHTLALDGILTVTTPTGLTATTTPPPY